MKCIAMYKFWVRPRLRIPGAAYAIRRCIPSFAATHNRTIIHSRVSFSKLRAEQENHGAVSKTGISSTLFDQMKQFLSNPDPAQHDMIKRIIDTMLHHHVYATMRGEEASVMVMVTHAMQEYDSVISVYQSLRDHNVPPSPITLELVSDACARIGKHATALEIVERMHDEGDTMLPLGKIYENAIRACHQDGKWIKSMHLFDEMASHDLQTPRELYVECLTLCTQNKEPNATRKLLAKVQHTFPNEELKTLLLSLLKIVLKEGNLENAFLLIDELREKVKWRITKDILARMMEVCASERAWDRAESLLTQYTGESSFGQPIVYPSKSYTSNVRAMMIAMKDHQIPMTLDLYNAALREYGRHRLEKEAIKLFQEIIQAGLIPNEVSYNAVMQSLDRNIGQVKGWFSRLKAQNQLNPTRDTYLILMKALSRANLWQEVITTFEEVSQRHSIDRDHRIMSIVTVAHARLRNYEKLLQLFCDMKMRGLDLPIHLHGEAMFAYIYTEQWQNALLLFQHVTESGQFDTNQLAQCAIIWDAVIFACVRGKQHKQMERYYTEMTHYQVRPSVKTVIQVIKHLDNVQLESIWNTFGSDYRHVGIVNETLQRAMEDSKPDFVQLVLSDAEAMGEAGCIHYNSMTYSLFLRYFAMKNDVANFTKVCKQMNQDDKVTVTVFTYRAILQLIQNLARDIGTEGVTKDWQPIFNLIGVDPGAIDGTFEGTAKRVLMHAEDQGYLCDPVCLRYYVGMCHNVEDAEVVLRQLENGFRSANSFVLTSAVLDAIIVLFGDYDEQPDRICDLMVRVFETQSCTELKCSALSAFCSVNSPQNVVRLFESLCSSLARSNLLQKDQVVYFIARLVQPDAPLEQLDTLLRIASKSDLAPLPPSSVALIVEGIAEKRFRENISPRDQHSLIRLACSGYTNDQIRTFLKVLGASPELKDVVAVFEEEDY